MSGEFVSGACLVGRFRGGLDGCFGDHRVASFLWVLKNALRGASGMVGVTWVWFAVVRAGKQAKRDVLPYLRCLRSHRFASQMVSLAKPVNTASRVSAPIVAL